MTPKPTVMTPNMLPNRVSVSLNTGFVKEWKTKMPTMAKPNQTSHMPDSINLRSLFSFSFDDCISPSSLRYNQINLYPSAQSIEVLFMRYFSEEVKSAAMLSSSARATWKSINAIFCFSLLLPYLWRSPQHCPVFIIHGCPHVFRSFSSRAILPARNEAPC
jgi:hypothetical protein